METDFDYEHLGNLAGEARETAARIRSRRADEVIETGRDLIAMCEKLGPGDYGRWFADACDFSDRTGRLQMQVARWDLIRGKYFRGEADAQDSPVQDFGPGLPG
jgi:hypothetical protein